MMGPLTYAAKGPGGRGIPPPLGGSVLVTYHTKTVGHYYAAPVLRYAATHLECYGTKAQGEGWGH